MWFLQQDSFIIGFGMYSHTNELSLEPWDIADIGGKQAWLDTLCCEWKQPDALLSYCSGRVLLRNILVKYLWLVS